MRIVPDVYSKNVYDFNTDDITVYVFKMTFLNVPNKFAPLNIRELITPVLLTKNLIR